MVKTALLMQAGVEFRIQSLVRELRSTCRTMWPKKREKTLVLLTVPNRTQRKSCLRLYKYRHVKNTEERALELLTSLITCLGRLDTCSRNSFDIFFKPGNPKIHIYVESSFLKLEINPYLKALHGNVNK